MLYNYFKIAVRTLLRNRSFTFINVLGLVLGISFSTMLYIYVQHELSYDSFHRQADRTYRVLTQDKSVPDNIRTYGVTMAPFGPAMVSTFPEVASMVRLHRFTGQVITEVNGSKFNERNWFTTDSNFFTVFDFDFKEGDRATALSQPLSVVLTASMAKKYFGDQGALNKTINVLGVGDVKVTGVLHELPTNSHLKFDLLFSAVNTGASWDAYLNNWQRTDAFTYIVLKEGKSIQDVEVKIPAFMKQHLGADAALIGTVFQPIQDIYLKSADIQVGAESEHGQLSYIYIFSTMAVFLLMIAAINYINLTTSKASTRAREIGIRKVAGAIRTQLIFQFLTEAFVITLVSMFLSLAVMDVCFPYFNQITGKNFDMTINGLMEYLPSILFVTLIIGILAGSYPAFYLARLKPIATLKGKLSYTRDKVDLRTALVVFQFTITMILIVSTLVIGNQMNFIQTKDIGFNKEQLMVIDINNGHVRRAFQAMKNEFSKISGVQHVAVSSRVPGEWKNIAEVYVKPTGEVQTKTDSLQTYFMGFDEDMLDTYQLHLQEGDFFSGQNASDSANVVINASAAQALNLTNPIGTTLRINTGQGEWRARIIGVLRDFNFQSLHQKIAPIIIGYQKNPIQSIDYFTLKVSGDVTPVIRAVTAVHEKFDEDTPIEYHFLNDQLNTFYVSEQKAGMIFRMGSTLSIIVACLGLLGLANYHVERRSKELGIRKVLGAGPGNLFMMMSLSFTRQVAIAFVFACPLAWYMMHEWLSVFEYRTLLSVTVFITAGTSVFLLALATVSYQSLRAARFNPADVLKSE